MIYTLFIVPSITIIAGYLMYKFPPKKINHIIGYRTKKSMKNKRNWQKANNNCGLLWIKIGVITFIISIILYILSLLNIIDFTERILAILTTIQIIPLLLAIPIVENNLK